LIAKERAAGNGASPGTLAAVATDGQVPASEELAGEPVQDTHPLAAGSSHDLASRAPSKLRYYLPFFEILGLLLFVLIINLFIFGSLRSITGSVDHLESQVSDHPRWPRVTTELDQLIIDGLKGGNKEPTTMTLLISRMLAGHLDEGDNRVEVLTSCLVNTQEALARATEELVVLSRNQALVRKSLYCMSLNDFQHVDPAAKDLCAGLKGDLLKGLAT